MSLTFRDARIVIGLTVCMTAFLVASQKMQDRLPAFSQSRAIWARTVGLGQPVLVIAGVCLVLSLAILLAIQTRSVRTVGGAAIVGLLISVISLPGAVALGVQQHVGWYAAARAGTVAAGIILAAVATVLARER